jgi:hypothetical protein
MNTTELRQNFKAYMQERFPNDSHISSTISMAFFLDRYGDEFGMGFHQVLSDKAIPDSYRQKLEEYFVTRGRKDPRSNASIYERSLRLLLEFIDGKPTSSSQPRAVKKSQAVSYATLSLKIPRPTKQSVAEYLDKWKQLPGYTEQEEALLLLFKSTFPNNKNLSEVLIKCSTLNDFYGTNIFNVYPLAKHIIKLDIDSRLADGDPNLVNDISLGHGITSRSGKELHLFSFATKYCSHHNPLDFPIYDSYVEKLLVHFRNADKFSSFRNEELRDFLVFKRVIIDFRRAYQLDDFNLKQIDQYLWQFGKEVFPKQYGRNQQGITPVIPETSSVNKEVEPMDILINKFSSDMESIYHTASKLGYTPTFFWKMVQSMGGYQAAKKLIYTKNPSSGLTRLWDLRRLDLSVEAHVIKPEYSSLFSEEERRICTERLESFGYKI